MANILDEAIKAAGVGDHSGRQPRRPPTLPPPPQEKPSKIIPSSAGLVGQLSLPASRLSSTIRLHRGFKTKFTPLGKSTIIPQCGSVHSLYDGRVYKSHLIEDMENLLIGTTSFNTNQWNCISCDSGHKLLPKKRNVAQWASGGKVVFMTDQNMPPVLPSTNGRCPIIIRIEDGSLSALGDTLCNILGDHALPEGSVLAMASMSHLMKVGLSVYTDRIITECRRFNSFFKGKVVVVPFLPLPLCGTNDPVLIRRLMDLSQWLDHQADYCLSTYNSLVRMHITGAAIDAEELVDHLPSTIGLPSSFTNHEIKLFAMEGWTELPGSLQPLSMEMEKDMICSLLTGLISHFLLELDTSPNLCRGLAAVSGTSSEDSPLIIGGSNAGKVAAALTSMGSAPTSITSGGWIISASSVSKVLPELISKCTTLPPDAPVVFYCLDNNSFRCSDKDGELSALQRGEDGHHHVVGDVVVTPEVTMAPIISHLGKLIDACGNGPVYVLTPLPRYTGTPCCQNPDHCTHMADPDYGIRICCETFRLNKIIAARLINHQNVLIVNTGDILVGKSNVAPSELLAAMSVWPGVHGPQEAYTKIALKLLGLFSSTRSGYMKRPREGAGETGPAQCSRGASFSGFRPPFSSDSSAYPNQGQAGPSGH